LIDGFWSGIFGGLIAPILSHTRRRFKYVTIFLVSVILANVFSFIAGVWIVGWKMAWQRTIEDGLTWVGILVPISIGLLVVLIVFICVRRNIIRQPVANKGDGGT
jgi:hypothetical protein